MLGPQLKLRIETCCTRSLQHEARRTGAIRPLFRVFHPKLLLQGFVSERRVPDVGPQPGSPPEGSSFSAQEHTARRVHASAAVRVGGKLYSNLYVFGGYDAGGLLSTAEVYDPASDSWAQVTSLTSTREALVAVAL